MHPITKYPEPNHNVCRHYSPALIVIFSVDPLETVGHSAKRILEKLKLLVIIEPNDGIIIWIKIGIDGARSGTHYSHHFSNMDLSDENFIIATL